MPGRAGRAWRHDAGLTGQAADQPAGHADPVGQYLTALNNGLGVQEVACCDRQGSGQARPATGLPRHPRPYRFRRADRQLASVRATRWRARARWAPDAVSPGRSPRSRNAGRSAPHRARAGRDPNNPPVRGPSGRRLIAVAFGHGSARHVPEPSIADRNGRLAGLFGNSSVTTGYPHR